MIMIYESEFIWVWSSAIDLFVLQEEKNKAEDKEGQHHKSEVFWDWEGLMLSFW